MREAVISGMTFWLLPLGYFPCREASSKAVDSSPILRPILLDMSRYGRPSHQVYMYFFLRSGWQVQFLEPDLKTPLPRKFTFTDPEKIRELARRGEAWETSEARQMLEHAIDTGRGGIYLRLTPAQYATLKTYRGR